MNRYFTNFLLVFIMVMLSVTLYAQKDVTQFLGIPVDGYKPEMIQKLKSKGFTINQRTKDVLDGEFNGTDVNIYIVTNNNKVWRIAVADANDISEGDIKIRFNKLIQQFHNNKNYLPSPDSTILKYTIPEDEDISYELSVKNKRYEAVFYQTTKAFDSLNKEKNILLAKEKLNNTERERLSNLILRVVEESLKSLSNNVWFMINERYGKYYITLFYDNSYNKANGEDL
jgi:hypothetical protein